MPKPIIDPAVAKHGSIYPPPYGIGRDHRS